MLKIFLPHLLKGNPLFALGLGRSMLAAINCFPKWPLNNHLTDLHSLNECPTNWLKSAHNWDISWDWGICCTGTAKGGGRSMWRNTNGGLRRCVGKGLAGFACEWEAPAQTMLGTAGRMGNAWMSVMMRVSTGTAAAAVVAGSRLIGLLPLPMETGLHKH